MIILKKPVCWYCLAGPGCIIITHDAVTQIFLVILSEHCYHKLFTNLINWIFESQFLQLWYDVMNVLIEECLGASICLGWFSLIKPGAQTITQYQILQSKPWCWRRRFRILTKYPPDTTSWWNSAINRVSSASEEHVTFVQGFKSQITFASSAPIWT